MACNFYRRANIDQIEQFKQHLYHLNYQYYSFDGISQLMIYDVNEHSTVIKLLNEILPLCLISVEFPDNNISFKNMYSYTPIGVDKVIDTGLFNNQLLINLSETMSTIHISELTIKETINEYITMRNKTYLLKNDNLENQGLW